MPFTPSEIESLRGYMGEQDEAVLAQLKARMREEIIRVWPGFASISSIKMSADCHKSVRLTWADGTEEHALAFAIAAQEQDAMFYVHVGEKTGNISRLSTLVIEPRPEIDMTAYQLPCVLDAATTMAVHEGVVKLNGTEVVACENMPPYDHQEPFPVEHAGVMEVLEPGRLFMLFLGGDHNYDGYCVHVALLDIQQKKMIIEPIEGSDYPLSYAARFDPATLEITTWFDCDDPVEQRLFIDPQVKTGCFEFPTQNSWYTEAYTRSEYDEAKHALLETHAGREPDRPERNRGPCVLLT